MLKDKSLFTFVKLAINNLALSLLEPRTRLSRFFAIKSLMKIVILLLMVKKNER